MHVIMLGTGAALVDPDRNHSSILLTVRGRHYLFDCGHGATHQLVRAAIDPVDVKARAQYPQRQKNFGVLRPDIRECKPGVVYQDELVRVRACYVEHIPREISPCFALRMDTVDRHSVVFSGDTAPCERLIELARDCDLLIHECTFPQKAIDFRSQAGIGTWAHTSPFDLGRIAVAARVKSLVATHFGHFDTTNPVLKKHLAEHMPAELIGPQFMDDVVADIRRTYQGPLRIAHDLMRIELDP